jgi:hypothetical protein
LRRGTLRRLAQRQIRNADRGQGHDDEQGDTDDLEEGFHGTSDFEL